MVENLIQNIDDIWVYEKRDAVFDKIKELKRTKKKYIELYERMQEKVKNIAAVAQPFQVYLDTFIEVYDLTMESREVQEYWNQNQEILQKAASNQEL